MLAEHITVLVTGRGLIEGRRDADTENSHSFMCELVNEAYKGKPGQESRLAAVTCRFEDEGRVWVRGKIDSLEADALRTVIALTDRISGIVCGACGETSVRSAKSCAYCGEAWA